MPMTSDGMKQTLGNPELQLAVYNATGRLMDKRKSAINDDAFPDYEDLRTHAHELKRHTIENLDWYLEEFERNVAASGGKVVWC
ncbi:MAG: (Fe-S)-binding protein, partial [Bryobacteraceae bacterium]|nr:(Fe-S)-binding protein [Bryobacteraceae bacterium]